MIKYIFIVSNGNFNNSLLIICRNDAAIVFVFGNITSNKVQGYRDWIPKIIFNTIIFHRKFSFVIP